jgi:hypothetical protein
MGKNAAHRGRTKGAGMSKKKTVRTVADFKAEYNPSADIVFLRKRVAELEAKRNEEKTATGEAMEIIHALREAIAIAEPVKMFYIPKKDIGGADCTHTAHITDWHYGAVTDRDEVDGFGEFNPDIAEKRVAKFGEMIIRKTKAQRYGYKVPYLRIIGTADFASGDIHQELQVTNAFPAPVQAVKCGYLMGGLFAMLAPHFERVDADIITLDNHGRLTKKPQAAQGGLNNWSYVVAEIAAQYVKSIDNVKVNVHAKPSAVVTVGPEKYLCFHGHQIKGWGGIPYYGLDRRIAMEAVKRMGLPEAAFTKLLNGHLHVAVDAPVWKLGGSLSGTDAFDHSCGRHAKPHQTSFFVHPVHGEFDFTRWWL